MKIAIRYYSETGNTEQLAEAIGKLTKVKPLSVESKLTEDVDILFLGSSVYYSGPKKPVKQFIKDINVKVGVVVNFSTATIMKSTYNSVKRLVEAKHLIMSPKEFHCKGSWAAFYESRPNERDLTNCREFTKHFLEQYKVKQEESEVSKEKIDS